MPFFCVLILRAAILAVASCVLVVSASAAEPILSLEDYTARLQQLESSLKSSETDFEELAANLPPSWQVRVGDITFEVDNAWLRETLFMLASEPDEDLLQDARNLLSSRWADAVVLSSAPADYAQERAALELVLSAREFRGVHGPTWYDRLRDRLMRMFWSLMQRIFGSSAAPMVGKVILWGLIALAVLVVGLWAYRAIKRDVYVESISPGPPPVSAKLWATWMADANASAARNQWREAIHFAYWAGISYLEAQGMWRPDRARTPREYLRLLPSSSSHRPALRSLTSQFELTWYAGSPAGQEEFSRVVGLLEQMGCHGH